MVGSNEMVWMKFYTAQGVHSGGLVIYFRLVNISVQVNLSKFGDILLDIMSEILFTLYSQTSL